MNYERPSHNCIWHCRRFAHDWLRGHFFFSRKSGRHRELYESYIGDVVHDIHASLAGIQTRSELFRSERQISRDLADLLENHTHEIRRISILMRDLLRVLHFDADMAPVVREPIDLRRLLVKITNYLVRAAQKKNISFSVTGSTASCVKGSELDLEEMFCTLLKNALAGAPRGAVVLIDIQNTYDGVTISIGHPGADSAAALGTMLRGFQKNRQRGSTDEEYSALALVVARKILEWHNGTFKTVATPDSTTLLLQLRCMTALENTADEGVINNPLQRGQ